MEICIYARRDMNHQIVWSDAFAEGLARHGVKCYRETPGVFRQADLAVMWSYRHTLLMETARHNGCDCLIMERGYLGDRTESASLGYNGLNGRATFVYTGYPKARGEEYYPLVQPWRTGNDQYYLICGQVLGDMSLTECPDYPAWLATLPTEYQGKPVLFRPHPVGLAYDVPHEHTTGATLDADLAGAIAMWCWNSNSAVDALLAGVPVTVFDQGSVAWPYAAQDIKTLVYRDRLKMVDALASAQWKVAEIASGEAWEHLKHYYD